MRFHFDEILLPDSNVNEPLFAGAVQFHPSKAAVAAGRRDREQRQHPLRLQPASCITEPSVLVAEFSTSIPEETEDPISVHPNPSSGIFRLSAGVDVITSVEVFATDSRRCSTISAANASTLDIDIGHLEAGAYLLRVLDSEQRQQIIPILLSH
ncbi:MAG: T9SS type A sorting domain-containing protein [Flavobacteriales bacterium]